VPRYAGLRAPGISTRERRGRGDEWETEGRWSMSDDYYDEDCYDLALRFVTENAHASMLAPERVRITKVIARRIQATIEDELTAAGLIA
jgi:hypothetical protein